MDLFEEVVVRRQRVPLPEAENGDGAVVARQLDAALVSAGFKLSRELFDDLAAREAGQAIDIGVATLRAAKRLVGDDVQHNPYFRDFPFNVPATLEFWAELMERALAGGLQAGVYVELRDGELVEAGSLLSLPGYGTVQHTYEDMLAAHGAFVAAAGDRVTVLHKGGTLAQETRALYLELAGSAVPLAAEDLALLGTLAAECAEGPGIPVPVRENLAVINSVALAADRPLLVDTVTDILRLVIASSGGDVTLETPARFRSLRRAERRSVIAALDAVVAAHPGKLADVARHAEAWKRLGERLHPHEHGQFPQAQRVFAVARGAERVPSLAARAERHFRDGETVQAARRLADSPGMLLRSLDRLLRAAEPEERAPVLDIAAQAAPAVSGRVLLSAREHFQNRVFRIGGGLPRIFANRAGRAWVTPETRDGIPAEVRRDVLAMLDSAIADRLPRDGGRVLVDPAMLGVALPLTGKPAAPGLGVMPRGSVTEVVPGDQDVLSFFVYWRQRARRTDYDLSALLVDADFGSADWVSWQSYNSADAAAVYSGDITDAPNGATEFISCDLSRMSRPVVLPQVLIYSGEPFDEAAEAYFGYMLRDSAQMGAPFEAATVRMKSDLRGAGRIALPLAFLRGEDGRWRVKWLHLYQKGRASMNVVQGNRLSTSLLARTIIERDYLRVEYLASLLGAGTLDGGYVTATPETIAAAAATDASAAGAAAPVTYIGLERPDGLPADATVFTLANLAGLIPE